MDCEVGFRLIALIALIAFNEAVVPTIVVVVAAEVPVQDRERGNNAGLKFPFVS